MFIDGPLFEGSVRACILTSRVRLKESVASYRLRARLCAPWNGLAISSNGGCEALTGAHCCLPCAGPNTTNDHGIAG